MIAALLFVVQHAAALTLVLALSAASGTAVLGPRAPLALRSILGLALTGQVLVVLGAAGAIRPWVLVALAALALLAGAARMEWGRPRWTWLLAAVALTLPLFALALFPPIAFDETLYHLPIVKAMAESGAIRFLPGLRFPIFPELHEALCVPGFLALGDVAPHLVAVAELILLAALLIAWIPGRVGLVAAALLVGNPIVVHLATVTYVELALMLFVAAGFFCLDRATGENETWYVPLAGLFFGTACSVKYLGGYFALAALVWVAFLGPNRRRRFLLFSVALIAGVAPMYARILTLTGNPMFPFGTRLFGASPWHLATTRYDDPWMRALRLFWDLTFARDRLNQQPPWSPFLVFSALIMLVAARRDRRAAFLCALAAVYIALFVLVMPSDSRYLLPLLPLVSIAAAPWISRWRALAVGVSLVSITAGLAYAGYRLTVLGPPPADSARRQEFLEQRIPEYRALERRGPGATYVCGAEQLQYYGRGEITGDWNGRFAYETVLGRRDAAQLAGILESAGMRFLLVSRRACSPEWQRVPARPFFEVVYADAGAVLWRVVPALPKDR